jgi:hypothetical protein
VLAILSSPSSTPSPLYLPSPIYSTTSVNPPHRPSYRNRPATGPPTAAPLLAPGSSSTEIQSHPDSQIQWKFAPLAASKLYRSLTPRRANRNASRQLRHGFCLASACWWFSAVSRFGLKRLGGCADVKLHCGSVRAGAVSRLKGICKSSFWGRKKQV